MVFILVSRFYKLLMERNPRNCKTDIIVNIMASLQSHNLGFVDKVRCVIRIIIDLNS